MTEWKIAPIVASGEYGVTIVDERGMIVASTYQEHASLVRAAPALRAALRALVASAGKLPALKLDDPTADWNVPEAYNLTLFLKDVEAGAAALAAAEGRTP